MAFNTNSQAWTDSEQQSLRLVLRRLYPDQATRPTAKQYVDDLFAQTKASLVAQGDAIALEIRDRKIKNADPVANAALLASIDALNDTTPLPT